MVKMAKMIKMVVGMEKFILELVYNLYLTRKGSEGCRNQIGFACAGSNPAVRVKKLKGNLKADVPEWLRGLTRIRCTFWTLKGESSSFTTTMRRV